MIKKILILTTGILVGILMIFQWRSMEEVNNLASRGAQSNLGHELAIMVSNNTELRKQLEELQDKHNAFDSELSVQKATQESIVEDEVLSGQVPVQGEGVEILIDPMPNLAEVTDLLNEVFQLGVEAVAINDIRLVNENAGITALGGQLVFDGKLLTAPLKIQAIGNGGTLATALAQSDGTLARISLRNAQSKINLTKGIIQMKAVVAETEGD